MTESELKKGQDVLDFIAAHGGPKMKAVPLEREADGPALPRGMRSAIDVLKRDAIRLCDRLDRAARGAYSTSAVREFLADDDVPWAGQAAMRLRTIISLDLVERRRSKHMRAEVWREEALRRADALFDRLLLCAAVQMDGGKEVRESMAFIKTMWCKNAA